MISAPAGWKGRAALRGSAAVLLFLLTGCSASVADSGAGAERPVQGSTASTPPPAEPQQPERTRPEVPVRSAALDDAAVERPVPPVRVRIPSLDIDLEVTSVGVQPNGEMEVPENPSVVGWYRYGPGPGSSAGATVLAAHVDSLRYGLGPFARLKTLADGAKVIVTDADGETHAYRVGGIERTGKSALVDTGVFDRSGAPRLHLITCGGTFDQGTRTYSDNVIVTATPAG